MRKTPQNHDFDRFLFIQIKISRELKGIRTIVDHYHDPSVIVFRSRASD